MSKSLQELAVELTIEQYRAKAEVLKPTATANAVVRDSLIEYFSDARFAESIKRNYETLKQLNEEQ